MLETQAYWYKLFVGACPVCGASKSYRERRANPKPVSRTHRVVYLSDTECYDGCLER